MSGTKRNYSPRRAGEVVGVEVDADAERPVTITCHDHAHAYEIAWRDTDDGPVITDLRVTSVDGVPITSDTLKRINTDRLARTAAMRDTAEAADAARKLRQTLDAATGTTDGHEWVERLRFTDGLIDAMVRHAPLGVALPTSGGKRVGRPRLSSEFLAKVAAWATEEAPKGGNVYERVAARAASELGRDVSAETVKGWVRRCKAAGLLKPDALRPRKPHTAEPTTDRQETDR
ncbi:hypothetical protein [Mycobacterium persicum]|uniref:Transposase n=1 Tax=Mycobacterium persicum TaxID=1487726 RepID=A0AB38UPS5_9MYCO|nr:hypothetical protein [Mycobacterium persicum]ORB91453.1 hypothetical protein B1T49_21960 [Mycobacterium persicum]VAZ82737.1 hypothetical protein LAUMK42_01547 [Mycobacterium persicum]